MIKRLALFLLLLLVPIAAVAQQRGGSVSALLNSLGNQDELKPLKTVVVARDGRVMAEHG